MESERGPRWRRRLGTWLRLAFKGERVGRFFGYTLARFGTDGCTRQAAGLAYVSLLSLVPLLAIALGVLSAFPAFQDIRVELQALIFENFLPESSAEVTEQMLAFVDNASKATVPGMIAFGVTAVLLLNNINGALNVIWRVSEPRPMALRLLVYWALLSLGPLLLGSSISLSSYAFAVVQYSGIEAYTGGISGITRVISVSLATLGFGLIYFIVPNRAVHWSHAFFGGLIAAVIFELLKAGFGLYLKLFPTYQAIYGALSAVPIFLVWLYLSWAVVLLGAEVAAALPEWRAAQARGRPNAGPGEQLALALGLLSRLHGASQSGGGLRERALVQGLPATPAEIDAVLRTMRRTGIAARSVGGRWILARDLTSLSLGDLARLLNLHLDPGEGWPKAATYTVDGLLQAGRMQLERSLADLLTPRDEAAE